MSDTVLNSKKQHGTSTSIWLHSTSKKYSINHGGVDIFWIYCETKYLHSCLRFYLGVVILAKIAGQEAAGMPAVVIAISVEIAD